MADPYPKSSQQLKRADDLAAVVAAQRELLEEWLLVGDDLPGGTLEVRTRAALDAEEVSEPEGNRADERHPSGSLTSPVHDNGEAPVDDPECGTDIGPLTFPVDTAPHPCQRCGSEEWTDVDYSGCSDCRDPVEPLP